MYVCLSLSLLIGDCIALLTAYSDFYLTGPQDNTCTTCRDNLLFSIFILIPTHSVWGVMACICENMSCSKTHQKCAWFICYIGMICVVITTISYPTSPDTCTGILIGLAFFAYKFIAAVSVIFPLVGVYYSVGSSYEEVPQYDPAEQI